LKREEEPRSPNWSEEKSRNGKGRGPTTIAKGRRDLVRQEKGGGSTTRYFQVPEGKAFSWDVRQRKVLRKGANKGRAATASKKGRRERGYP